MRDFVVMTDSSCDLPESMANELNLTVLPLSYTMDDKTYVNYLDWRAMSPSVFYQALRDKNTTKTTGVNFEDATEAMETILKQGKDILCLAFSSALSCTYSSFSSAATELREKYKESKIYVVDTLSASLGQGLLVYLTVQKIRAGADIDQARAFAEETKFHLCHWFTVDDLHHLKRGGRVSATTATIGSILSIKPVMHMDDMGRLTAVGKVRGRKHSINALFEHMQALAIKPEEQVVFISHGDCIDEAQALANRIKQTFHVKHVLVNYVGPVIGSHSGPGTMALFFVGQNR